MSPRQPPRDGARGQPLHASTIDVHGVREWIAPHHAAQLFVADHAGRDLAFRAGAFGFALVAAVGMRGAEDDEAASVRERALRQFPRRSALFRVVGFLGLAQVES